MGLDFAKGMEQDWMTLNHCDKLFIVHLDL